MSTSKLQAFKAQREGLQRLLSIPIDATRAKFDINAREIKGYPIVWGEKNSFDEIALKGCCTNSINARGPESKAGNPILVLNQHRQSEILCRPSVLREDDYGLYFEGTIIEGTQYADEAVAQIQQGVLRQLSYGFSYVWEKTEYVEAEDAYILREIKLWEVSPVTFSSGENAKLRSFGDFQRAAILGKYKPEELADIEQLVATFRTGTTTRKENAQLNDVQKLINLFKK